MAAAADIPALQGVAQDAGLFPGEMLPDMIDGYLTDGSSQDIWLVCEEQGEAIGFCYCVPEQLAAGTWNMLALGVSPSRQGKGAGKVLVAALESRLRGSGERVLIAETSGTEEFAGTRAFYRACGYAEEARVRDFWAPGDDKVVFWKAL
ncbi:MAG: GNAT family N-acetyltransferase [Novosphingobium sp.]|nr:GNAT family N-acetyltransferase [Novosphingobium sp.]MBY0393183.1 GNAT family N-acetyltransferase [Novosphingobium sp.]